MKQQIANQEVQKEFYLGSQWLYYKLYCGVKIADEILTSIIKPFTEQLLEENIIDKWFFIRYSDPETHLRIRFHLNDSKHLGDTIIKFHSLVLPLTSTNILWKVQNDTYKRELGRYGKHTIEEVESLFFIDSVSAINIISKIKTDEERLIMALKMTNYILTSFNFNKNQKLDFVEQMRNAFKNELNANKITTKQLNVLYSNIVLLNFNITDSSILLKHSMFKSNINTILKKENTKRTQINLNNLIPSIIHMSINRLFSSKQRQHEFVIYYCLSKFFRSQKAQNHA